MSLLEKGPLRNDGDYTRKSVFVNRPEKVMDAPWRWLLLLLGFALFAVWLFPNFYWPSEKTESVEKIVIEEEGKVEEEPLKIGDELLVVVGECPIYSNENWDGTRISSALFAEKVRVLRTKENSGRVYASLDDGTMGWFDIENLSRDFSLLDPEGLVEVVMVKKSMKRVMSHSLNGHVLMEVPMGTLLYADYSGADIYRLRLPDKKEGWVTQEGLSRLGEEAEPIVEEERKRFFASSAMNFYGSRYLPGGISRDGADMAGVVFIAAKVNGLELPRTLEAQAKLGESAEIIRDVTSNLPRPSLLEVGDVLYFHDGSKEKKIAFAAVMLEKSKALTQVTNDSTLVLRDLDQEPELLSRLVTVRRFFP